MPEFDFDSLNEVKEVKKELKASDIKEAIKKNAKKDDNISLMQDIFGIECENERNILAEKTKKSRKEIDDMIDEKKKELKGLISTEGALFIITKELGYDFRDIKSIKKEEKDAFNDVNPYDTGVNIIPIPLAMKTEPIKKPEKSQPKITKQPIQEEFPIEIIEKSQSIVEKKQYILEALNLLEFTIKNILKPSDYYNGNITKSGALKLAATFNISFEVISIEVENEYDKDGKLIDVHAHAKAKAIKTNGSYNIATGDKSKSEYWSEKKQNYGRYNLHYLRQTAATRATNRAILNAVGFGMVSAEEIEQKDAFGGE